MAAAGGKDDGGREEEQKDEEAEQGWRGGADELEDEAMLLSAVTDGV